MLVNNYNNNSVSIGRYVNRKAVPTHIQYALRYVYLSYRKKYMYMNIILIKLLLDSGAEEDIPLYNVKISTLKKVIEYLTHIKQHPAQEI